MRRRQNGETPLYKQALDWCAVGGFVAWRQNAGMRGGVRIGFAGMPDICGYHKTSGRALYIECKIDGERLKIEQFEFLKRAHDSNCYVFVWTEKTYYLLPDLPDAMRPRYNESRTANQRRRERTPGNTLADPLRPRSV